MATLTAEYVAESEFWGEDELSEMMSLLQRAEQRMRELNPGSNHSVEATNSDKSATTAHFLIFRI